MRLEIPEATRLLGRSPQPAKSRVLLQDTGLKEVGNSSSGMLEIFPFLRDIDRKMPAGSTFNKASFIGGSQAPQFEVRVEGRRGYER